MSLKINILGATKHCAVCGKEFEASSMWVYKNQSKYFCSYSCSRVFEKMIEEKHRASKEAQRAKQRVIQRERYWKKKRAEANA